MRKNRARLLIGYLIAVASIAFTLHYLQVNREDFLSALAAMEPWRIGASGLLFSSMLAINAIAFAAAVRSLDVPVSARVCCAAWLSSLLAKYIPVGVGHIAGRGAVLVSHGVSWRSVVVTGVFEQAVSLAWCLLIVWVLHAGLPFLLLVIAAPVSLLCGVLFCAVVRKLGFSASVLGGATSVLLYCVAMLPYALGYLVLVDVRDALGFMSSLFAGTIAGVLAIVSPGGLGIRESVAAATAPVGAGGVLPGLFAARLVILVMEVLGSVLGGWLMRQRQVDGG